MIEFLAEKCTFIFEAKDIIKEEREIYKHGFEVIISSSIGTLGVVLVGIITNHLIDALIYEILFIFTRRKLGGYHCKSYFNCISTYMLLFMIVFLLKAAANLEYIIFVIIFVNIVIISLAPVENINNPISRKQKNNSKIYAIVIVFVLDIIVMLLITNNNLYYSTIIYTLLIIALLMIGGEMEYEKSYNKSNDIGMF